MFGKRFKVKQDHWLFKSKNALRLIQKLARKHMTAEDVAHFLSQNRTAMLNQNISVTSKEFENAAAEFSLNLIRRARAGVGFEPNVCSRSKLTKATNGHLKLMRQSSFNCLLGTLEIWHEDA